jgi:hypothetical protein
MKINRIRLAKDICIAGLLFYYVSVLSSAISRIGQLTESTMEPIDIPILFGLLLAPAVLGYYIGALKDEKDEE